MLYTNEEYEMLKSNTKAIENYLRNIMPNLRDGIRIPFGKMTTRGRYGEIKEPYYELVIKKDYLIGWAGCLKFEFSESAANQSSCTSVYSKGFGSEFMASLINEWQIIKRKVIDSIQQQEAYVSAIKNFKL